MLSLRFQNEAQKEVQLATLRHLFVEHHGDQVARTCLTNAIAMAEATMVTGQLDDMIAKTNRMQRNGGRIIICVFALVAASQLALGYYLSWPNYISAFATLIYAGSLMVHWHIQKRYYTSLKWLESLQLELPPVPTSLKAVN